MFAQICVYVQQQMSAHQRLLPHLAAASNEMLGGDDEKLPAPTVRAAVAAKAGAGQHTVDRFLKGDNTPRSGDLDRMVTAVAEVSERDWLDPWKAAIRRAQKARADLEEFVATGSAGADGPNKAPAEGATRAAKTAREATQKSPGKSPGKRGPTATKRRAG